MPRLPNSSRSSSAKCSLRVKRSILLYIHSRLFSQFGYRFGFPFRFVLRKIVFGVGRLLGWFLSWFDFTNRFRFLHHATTL